MQKKKKKKGNTVETIRHIFIHVDCKISKHFWNDVKVWYIVLESIQGIRKRPTHRFEDTIVWERCYF